MKRITLYKSVTVATGFTGTGMILGYAWAHGSDRAPLWAGLILILLSAVTLGMLISSKHPPTAEV